MANDDAPWTIKGVSITTREKAVRYARMAGVTVAEWHARAVETEANRQDGNAIIPPRAASPVASLNLGDVAAALAAMASAKVAGLPVADVAVRETVTTIRGHMREARGLPPLKVRQTGWQTNRQIGQTIRPVLANGHGAVPTLAGDH